MVRLHECSNRGSWLTTGEGRSTETWMLSEQTRRAAEIGIDYTWVVVRSKQDTTMSDSIKPLDGRDMSF